MLTTQTFEKKYIVYVRKNDKDCIIEINSSAFLTDVQGWIKIDEGIGDKFHHAQNHYLDGPVFDPNNIPRYKLVEGTPILRSDEEIASDVPNIAKNPTSNDQLRADIDFIAAMTGVEL